MGGFKTSHALGGFRVPTEIDQETDKAELEG
jgi:hypothetical protein